ncbi:MAG: D-tyrosyl-tRNA(Tyr) deacylase [Limnochordales bacterium]|nr:D-tyrosyl-tRNA(Tyr) deacylase [Limnochordales bacterium]
MRAVIQRVSSASVTVDGELIAAIGRGLLVLLGVGRGDTPQDAAYLSRKVVELRIFDDEKGRMNRSIRDVGGEVLIVSQFTLYADAGGGRRPSFAEAAPAALARPLYEMFVEYVRQQGVPVQTGQFGAMMAVQLVNDGPVTILVESERKG